MVLPKTHIRDMEDKVKKNKIFNASIFIGFFTISYFFIGAILHEISHIAILKLASCSSSHSWSFSVYQGLRASIKPLCSLNGFYLTVFYISGYGSVLVSGIVAGTIAVLTSKKKLKFVLTGLGTGLLLSLISSLSMRGDIANSLRTVDLPEQFSVAIYIFTAILASAIIFGIIYHLEN